MKYPALLAAGDVLAHLADYDSIIDVRSESEFALDHVPVYADFLGGVVVYQTPIASAVLGRLRRHQWRFDRRL